RENCVVDEKMQLATADVDAAQRALHLASFEFNGHWRHVNGDMMVIEMVFRPRARASSAIGEQCSAYAKAGYSETAVFAANRLVLELRAVAERPRYAPAGSRLSKPNSAMARSMI